MNYEDLIFDIEIQKTYYHVKKLLDQEGFGPLLNTYISGYSGKVKFKKRFIFKTFSVEGVKVESFQVRRSRLISIVAKGVSKGASEGEIVDMFKQEIGRALKRV